MQIVFASTKGKGKNDSHLASLQVDSKVEELSAGNSLAGLCEERVVIYDDALTR